ncbi:MAG: FAD-dependent oxidoreductase [Phycisphaerales bacterium JB037]
MTDQRVVIAGAGLAGALLALMLGQRGYRVLVVERRPDPRAKGFIGGRSINLALSARGLDALARVGLTDKVLADAIPMPGRMLHAIDGALSFQPYSDRPTDAINSVSRGGLNLLLMQAADEHPSVELVFGMRCERVDLDAPALVATDANGNEHRYEGAAIIGADGAFSAVRLEMMKTDRFDYSQSYLSHGYKELHIPPAAECGVDPAAHGGFAMEPRALHIWPRGGAMMIALPNPDHSFTCTLFWPFDAPDADEPRAGFAQVDAMERVTPFFERVYPDAVPLMPTLEHDYRHNPTSSLVTVRCEPWQRRGKVALVGDAAHAIVPFYGQGMNAAFEDCVALSELLDEHRGEFARALPEYSALRKPHADAIADMALANFIEMRDTVADPGFQHRKRIEQALHAAFGERAEPLYNLVSFSTVPYAEARERGRALSRIVERIAERFPRQEAAGVSEESFQQRVRALGEPLLASNPAVGRGTE